MSEPATDAVPWAPVGHRDLHSPVTDDQLSPSPDLVVLQFGRPLTDSDHQRVAIFLEANPQVTFRMWSSFSRPADLEFLKWYPRLKRFAVSGFYNLRNFRGLRYLPDDLESLEIGQTKARDFSWNQLVRFRKLRQLYVEAQTKDLSAISQLTSLEELTLRSITLPGLELLIPLKRLWSLDLKLGGTSNLAALPQLKKLKYLELWMIRGLADLSMLPKVPTLQSLFLQALKNLTELPSLENLKALRCVHLQTMKGLRDLAPVAKAPRLEQLIAVDMRQIPVEGFRCFVGHPKLKAIRIDLGSLKRDAAVHELLGLPEIDFRQKFQFR